MPIPNELLNEIETELFAENGSSEFDASKTCEQCGNQPCTCHKSEKVCPTCGKNPCQCNKSKTTNNSTQDTTMPLFDDPELNQLFDEHAPGEGAASGKEAKDPNVTEGQMAGELSKRKKCKSIEEELFSGDGTETPAGDDKTPAGDDNPPADDGTKAANDTTNGDPADATKKGKKHKSDIADLFSDDLFKIEGEEDGKKGKKDDEEIPGEGDGDEDEDEDFASLEAELASEEAALDFDL